MHKITLDIVINYCKSRTTTISDLCQLSEVNNYMSCDCVSVSRTHFYQLVTRMTLISL